ncbi:MAG: alpha/beta hydrolase [Francisellaceae bacterium]
MQNAVILEPERRANSAVIWCHGLGADGHDFASVVPELHLADDNAIRFIFPHAPKIPITINMGMVMPGWYDIKSISEIKRDVDVNGILNSVDRIANIIDQQIKQGIASENIILAGFSQGGVIALYTALMSPHRLAGVLALSTYLPAWEEFADKITTANKETDVIVAHGRQDPIVPFIAGQHLAERLKDHGFNVCFHAYDMPHSVCMEEIAMIANVIKSLNE